MAQISNNMLLVEKFFCFISLRGGTLFSLYVTLIFCFHAAVMAFAGMRPCNNYGHLLYFEGLMILGILVSSFALLYFPENNKKYHKKSMNAKCIQYFSIFSGLWAISIILIFSCVLLDNNRINLSLALVSMLCTGLNLHFTAVAHSFYKSIIQPKPAKMLINIRIPSLSSQSPPPIPPRDNLNINRTENIYI